MSLSSPRDMMATSSEATRQILQEQALVVPDYKCK